VDLCLLEIVDEDRQVRAGVTTYYGFELPFFAGLVLLAESSILRCITLTLSTSMSRIAHIFQDFFGSEIPLRGAVEFAMQVPALQSRVTVCGYPTGGSTICLTEGVVSRVDDVTISPCQVSTHKY